MPWRKWISRWFIGEAISNWMWSKWPVLGAPVVTAILGYLGEYSLVLIFLFCLGAFAMIAFGLNQFSAWNFERTPENKLQIGGIFIGKVIPDPNDTPMIESIKLGVSLNNTARFPIEFIVYDIRSRIAGRVSTTPKNLDRNYKIDAGGRLLHADNGPDLKDAIELNGFAEGDFYIKIEYGHPGKRKFQLEHAYAVLFGFNDKGDIRTTDATIIDVKGYLKGEKNVVWQIPEPRRSPQTEDA